MRIMVIIIKLLLLRTGSEHRYRDMIGWRISEGTGRL